MYRMKLFFGQTYPRQLVRTVFSVPAEGRELTCIRGKGAGAYLPHASFQWTNAVKALCELLIRAQLDAIQNGGRKGVHSAQFVLEGGAGTSASSLDYAISRQPLWLLDMFGVDSSGISLARRFIRRWNSDRSSGDIVALSINENFLPTSSVDFLIGTGVVNGRVELGRLLDELADSAGAAQIKRKQGNPQRHGPTLGGGEAPQFKIDEMLRVAYTDEVSTMLRTTNIFNRQMLTLSVNRLRSNRSFIEVAGKQGSFESQLDLTLSASNRLGLTGDLGDLRRHLTDTEPIRIATAGTIAGTTLILRYLRKVKGYNIDLTYTYASTNDIVDSVLQHSFERPPDACVVGVLPAAPLFVRNNKSEYSLIMIMPKASNRVVGAAAPNVSRTFFSGKRGASYIFCSDRPTSASFCFEELRREGVIHSKKVSVLHMDPHEVFAALKSGDSDLRSILWFPHYHFNKMLNRCEVIPGSEMDLSLETLLFAHHSFARNSRKLSALCVAIRSAWLELQMNVPLVEQLVDDLLSDGEYIDYLYRISGVFQMDNLQSGEDSGGEHGKRRAIKKVANA